jgi:hypothetical protein
VEGGDRAGQRGGCDGSRSRSHSKTLFALRWNDAEAELAPTAMLARGGCDREHRLGGLVSVVDVKSKPEEIVTGRDRDPTGAVYVDYVSVYDDVEVPQIGWSRWLVMEERKLVGPPSDEVELAVLRCERLLRARLGEGDDSKEQMVGKGAAGVEQPNCSLPGFGVIESGGNERVDCESHHSRLAGVGTGMPISGQFFEVPAELPDGRSALVIVEHDDVVAEFEVDDVYRSLNF